MPGFVTAALSVDLALLGVPISDSSAGVLTSRTRTRAPGCAYHVGLGLLLGVGVLIVSGLIQSALQALGVRQTQLVELQCVREFPLVGFLAVVLAGGVLAPIAEELYFRGVRLPELPADAWTAAVRTAPTSLLFATLHLNLPAPAADPACSA